MNQQLPVIQSQAAIATEQVTAAIKEISAGQMHERIKAALLGYTSKLPEDAEMIITIPGHVEAGRLLSLYTLGDGLLMFRLSHGGEEIAIFQSPAQVNFSIGHAKRPDPNTPRRKLGFDPS